MAGTYAGAWSSVFVSGAVQLIAFAGVSWLADRFAGTVVVEALRRAGQMTLSLYVAHILVFNLVVDWLGWVEPGGVGTALACAFGFWAAAIVVGAWWYERFGRGPAERVYPAFGG